jgi:hypothetical protein
MMADKFVDFQKRVERVLDDIVEYYENGSDAADDVILWAREWAIQRELDWLELKALNPTRKGY